MQIEEILNKGLERKYQVTIDPKALSSFTDQEALKISAHSKMDGFRPGKTPIALIKSTHKFDLQSKAAEHFIQEAIGKIVTENKIQLASQPLLNEINQDEHKLNFSLEMEVLPEMPSIDLATIEIDKYTCEVGEKDIKKTEEDFLKLHKSFEPSEKEATLGDITVIDATGYMNGTEFEGGKVVNHRLELGSKAFIEGFETGLVGVKVGESKRLKLKFPENYHMKDYSSQPVEFEVVVKEVLTPKSAKIDEELVKKVQAQNVQEIHDKIKEASQAHYDNLSELIMRKEILDHFDKTVKLELPPKLLTKETEEIKKSDDGKELDDKEIKKLAERRTKLGLLMAKISQENKVTVSEDDIKNEVMKQIQRMPAHAQAIVDYYRNTPAATDALKGQILENNTMLFMLGKVKANQKKVTPEKISDIYSKIIKRDVE